MAQHTFVAGDSGFLGRHVVKKLTERGLHWTGASLHSGVDFRDLRQVDDFFDRGGFDSVINCSAFVGGIQFGYEHPAEMFDNNARMATNLMDSARRHGVKRFVNPISNCSYPARLLTMFTEDQWWDGPLHESVMVYGFIRKASWVQGWAYAKQYGFDSVHLILSNMYGPEDHFEEVRSHALGALVMKFAEAKRAQLPTVTVWGSGKPIREWLYVEDGAEAMVRALDIAPTVDPINIGMGRGTSMIELAQLIKEEVGYEGEIALDPSKPDGAVSKFMSSDRLETIFGWRPMTTLEDGVRKTVQWYQEHHSS